MSRQKQHLNYTFILKLNEQDRNKLNTLQLHGINMSEEFRRFVTDLFNKKIIQNDKHM
jgi:hypothetical protein